MHRPMRGLANVYALLPSYGVAPFRDSFAKSAAAARRALELDEGLAEAHATLGLVAVQYGPRNGSTASLNFEGQSSSTPTMPRRTTGWRTTCSSPAVTTRPSRKSRWHDNSIRSPQSPMPTMDTSCMQHAISGKRESGSRGQSNSSPNLVNRTRHWHWSNWNQDILRMRSRKPTPASS